MKETKLLIISACLGVVLGIMVSDIFNAINRDISNEKTIVVKEIVDRPLTEWEIMKLAIIKTESDFNSTAIGKGEDWGIFQITPIYVKEVNRILGYEKFSHEDAFNEEKSIEMFNIMQGKHTPKMDIEKAIKSHNPTAMPSYLIKVKKNMEYIKKYESLREKVH